MGGEDVKEKQLLDLKLEMVESYRPSLDSMVMEKMRDQAPCFIVHMETGSILFASKRINEIFGYIHNELESEKISDLIPERFRSKHEKHLSGFTSNPHQRQMGSSDQALLGLKKDGTEFPIKISLDPFYQNSIGYVFATLMMI